MAFGARSRGARVVIFNRNFGKNLTQLSLEPSLCCTKPLHFCKERAKALAEAVSGEALPYECLHDFRPEQGMILANASAVGMEPNIHQTPVPKVFISFLQSNDHFSKKFKSVTIVRLS